MEKETFYFSHDYDSRSDPKIKKLMVKHQWAGYGLFWAIIEELYKNANALPTDYESIAFDLRSDENLIKSVILDFELFEVNDSLFSSKSIKRRLLIRELKSEKARQSAQARWKNVNANEQNKNANALLTECDSNAIKDSKRKDSKRKKIINKGSHLFSESDFFDINNFKEQFLGTKYAAADLDYYHESLLNWSKSKNEKKNDWIATAKNWIGRDMKEGKLKTTDNLFSNGTTQIKTDRNTGAANALAQLKKLRGFE